jgi:hypothetical protein
MKACSFLSFEDKRKMIDALAKGDQNAVEYVIREFDRLENTIKNYETKFDVVHYQIESIRENKPATLNF